MIKILYNLVTRSLVVLLVALLSVNYLPDTLFGDFPFEPKSVETNKYDSVIPLWNTKLSDGVPEYIQLNNILGPESIAIARSGLLYTGLADGRLVELDPSKNYKLRQVLKFKNLAKCKDNIATLATECGRFLQLRFQNDTLYALEANSGLYKIDIRTGTKTFVGPKSLNKINLFNSFAFDPKDSSLVYLTVSSTKWDLLNIMWSLMELDSNGQVVALDINSGKRVIVLDNVELPNGLDVDNKRNQLLFSQSTTSKISSLDLGDVRAAFKSAKDGDRQSNVRDKALIPLVPGMPDNIVVDGDIAYIALPSVKLNGTELIDHLSTMPNIRKAIGRFVYGAGKLLEYVSTNLYPHPLLETAYRELKSGHLIYRVIQTDKSAVLEYNLATGSSRLLGSDKFSFLSEATPDSKGNLLLGSFRSPFIVKVKL